MNLSADVLAKIGVGHSPQLQTAKGPLLKRSEVAAILGVSPMSVQYWERKGLIKATAKTNRNGWSLFAWHDLRAVLRVAISDGLFESFSARTKNGPALGTSIPYRSKTPINHAETT